MDNGISKEQRDYYKEKKRLELQTNLENNISELQKEIQQLEQALKSNNIEDKIIGLQTSINPELIKQLFSQQEKVKRKMRKYEIVFFILFVVQSVTLFTNTFLLIFITPIFIGLLILLTLKVPMSTCGPPLKEVKLFIKQNKLSENPNELKEAIDRIKKTLYYNKRINSNIYFLETLEEQLQEIKE